MLGRCIHVPQDSPFVQYLLTSWQLAWQPSHSLPHTYKQAMVGLKTSIYHAATASQCETRQTLYQLSYTGSAIWSSLDTCLLEDPPPPVLIPSGGQRNTVGMRTVHILLECYLVMYCLWQGSPFSGLTKSQKFKFVTSGLFL